MKGIKGEKERKREIDRKGKGKKERKRAKKVSARAEKDF